MDYRKDIDGLRAYAVLAVLVFHLDANWLSGGYVGVDAFFVISGFLITRLITVDLEAGRFSLGHFYLRRARRLLPAALATSALTAGAAWLVLPSSLLQGLWASAFFSSVSLANVYFWTDSSYFDGAALTKPLLHMWSLGVEEQFYLAWPGLLLLIRRLSPARFFRGAIAFTMLGLLVGSFWWAQTSIAQGTSGAFYLPHLRAWEFAVGGLLAQLPDWARARKYLGHPVFVLGLGALGWSAFGYSEETLFPASGAIAPCLGTAALIWAGAPRYVGRLLDNPVAIGIGKISYSVYLVHWPLVVLTAHSLGRETTALENAGIGAASLALGYLMWRMVEQRFRRSRGQVADNPARASLAFVTGTALCLIALLVITGTLWSRPPTRSSDVTARNRRMLRFLKQENRWADRYSSQGECYVVDGQRFPATQCLRAAPGAPSKPGTTPGESAVKQRGRLKDAIGEPRLHVLLIGDSLSANLYAGMSQYWGRQAQVDLAASPSCRPVLDASRGTKACKSRNRAVFHTADLSGYDLVLMHGNFYKSRRIKAIPAAVAALRARGAQNVMLLGPTLGYRFDVKNTITKHAASRHRDLLAELKARLRAGSFESNDALRAVAKKADIPFISVVELQCPDGTPSSCLHTMGGDGNPITRDNIHLSRSSAMWLLGRIEQHRDRWPEWPHL